jgi:non-specific protein-tyrosine kinase
MAEILSQVRQQADLVVVDTPPVLAVTDAAVLAPRVDGVLLVVRPGVTKVAALKQAVEQIRHVGGHLLGVVLNDVELKRVRYYYSYKGYYYTYYSQYTESESESRARRQKGKKVARSRV